MAFDFTKAFNSFAETGTALNRGVNKMIGKDIFKDIKPIEESREFPPYGSFPEYDIPEPEQWFSKVGSDKSFKLSGSVITVPKNLDSCIQYRNEFKTAAKYYAERFAFKYQNCVQDFDTLIHYFSDMYFEGLKPMLERAYSLLLPFGVFSASYESFYSRQIETYQRAISSYEKMSGVELSKNQTAEQAGNMVGGSCAVAWWWLWPERCRKRHCEGGSNQFWDERAWKICSTAKQNDAGGKGDCICFI